MTITTQAEAVLPAFVSLPQTGSLGMPSLKHALFAGLLCATLPLCAFQLTVLEETDLTVIFRSDAETLAYDRPTVGTLEITTKAHEEVILPELQARFRGFAFVENFAAGRVEANGKAKAQWRFQLTPNGVGPWQLRPFVLQIKNKRTGITRSCLTQPITFPAPPALPAASGEPETALEPEWVAPGWRTIRWWVLFTLLGIGCCALIRPCIKHIRRIRHERSLSPEERAKLDLARLLEQGLLEQGQFKRFFYGLSNVVRCYFERAHGLRATRQTSQEFLNSIADDSRISAAERAALAQFLTSADAIKFADIASSRTEAETATQHVRTLLEQAAAHRLEQTKA